MPYMQNPKSNPENEDTQSYVYVGLRAVIPKPQTARATTTTTTAATTPTPTATATVSQVLHSRFRHWESLVHVNIRVSENRGPYIVP